MAKVIFARVFNERKLDILHEQSNMFSLHNHNNLGRSTCFFILKAKNLSSFKISLVPLNSLSPGNSKTAAEDIYKYHPEQKKNVSTIW